MAACIRSSEPAVASLPRLYDMLGILQAGDVLGPGRARSNEDRCRIAARDSACLSMNVS